jgi:phenylacetic acid degradation operon negative regulatory protein
MRDDEAFVERMWLVHDFRKFAYVDPGLPSTLLPAHWPGTVAGALFREYYAAISKKAENFFRSARE